MGKGTGYTAYPMTDALSRSVYLLVLLCFLASLAMVYALGFKIPMAILSLFWTWPFLAVAGMLAQRIGKFRLASMM